MSRYWSELVSRLTPYVPGEQPRGDGLVKLNTNESPYPPSPRVGEAIAAASGRLRLYPDPESTALRLALAERNGLAVDQVFVGNGSDEVLALTFMALLKHDKPLCFPDISYSFYPVWCELLDIDYRQVPLVADFRIDPGDYPRDCGGVIVPNPNAPTGIVLGIEQVRSLLQRCSDSVVVIDEAYIDFGGDSATRLIDEFDNLLVVQTLSKSRSLAGLRVGMAMGQAPLVEALQRVKNSFNSYPLDTLAQAAAVAALEDESYFRESCDRIIASRRHLADAMATLGFEVLPSSANFVFATHPGHAARELFAALRERNIIVRYFDKPRIDGYLRITVGTDEQCAALLAALGDILGQ